MDSQKSKYVTTLTADAGITPLGPYSTGKIIAPGATFIYLSGQLGLDPKVSTINNTDSSLNI